MKPVQQSDFKKMVFLCGLAIVTRLIPHPPNVTAMESVALFAGVSIHKRSAIFCTFLSLIVSDVILGFYAWNVLLSVYGSLFAITLIGAYVKPTSLRGVLMTTLGASFLFYLVTNAAVWKFSGFYPSDISGLLQSYVAAIPFFRNSLIGSIAYSSILYFVLDKRPQVAFKTREVALTSTSNYSS